MGFLNWFEKEGTLARVRKAILQGRQSELDEVLAPLLQAITIPTSIFSKFTIQKATNEGYKCTNMVYRCVNMISDNMITLDFEVVGPDEQPIENHPAVALLNNPNPELPPHIAKAIWWKQLELTGACYIRFKDGPKPELWPIYPDKVRIIPSKIPGQLIQGYHFINSAGIKGNTETYLPEEVIHLRHVDPSDGFQGVSALQAGFRNVDILCEMDKWNYNSFLNRVASDMVISLKAENIGADEIKQIRDSIERQMQGPKNAHKVVIAPGGTAVDRMSQTAVEMDFTEGKKITREDIAVAYGIPLPVLGIYDNGTFNNVESAKRDMWEDTLVPKANGFCDTFTWFFRKVGMLGDDQKIIFKKQGIKALQRNFTERVKDSVMTQMMLQKAGYENTTIMEEINKRFELGLNLDKLEIAPEPTLDENGNPINTPAEKDEPKDGKKDKADKEKRAHQTRAAEESKAFYWRSIDRKRQMFEDKAKRKIKKMFSGELEKLLTNIETQGKVDFALLQRETRELTDAWEDTLESIYRDTLTSFGKQIFFNDENSKRAVPNPDEYDRFLQEHIDGYVRVHTGLRVKGIRATTMTDIEKIIKKAVQKHSLLKEVQTDLEELEVFLAKTVPGEIRELYSGFNSWRSLLIARTEVASASGSGMQKSFILSGAEYKQWLTSRDGHVRDSHQALEGEIVRIDAVFSNGAKFPGDPAAGVAEIANERCTMIAKRTL